VSGCGTGIFILQAMGIDVIRAVFSMLGLAAILWTVGAEITRRDDRRLGILLHYFISRWLVDVFDLIVTRKGRDKSIKGLWYEI